MEGLGHKLLDNTGVEPRCTQAHINFGGFQFSGLCLGQRLHIDGKFRVGLGGKLRHPQLCPDIAGQVLVCHLPARFRIVGVGGRVFEDHAGKFGGNAPILAGRAQQFCHIGQVHLAVFPDGHRQRFAGGIHTGDSALRANRPFRKHCSFALELPLLVQIFQGAEQIVRGVLLKQPPVSTVIQQAIFGGKGIIGGVQFCLCRLNVLVRVVVQLLFDQVVDNLPQLHHAGDTALGGVGQFHLRHHGIFPVEHFAVHHGVGEVFYLRVSRQGAPGGFLFGNIGSVHLGGGVLPLDVLHRFGKLVCKVCTLDGRNGQVVTVLGAFGGKLPQHHLRVVHKILVDGKAVLGLAKLYPVRLNVRRAITLLQKDNITDDICAGVSTERIIRQTDGTQQIGTLCHVLAGGAVLAVHGVAAGDERHHAARTHLVDGFCKKIIVDGKSQLVVRFIVDFVLTERHVAHRQIVEITAVGGLKASNSNVGLRIQHLGNAPGNAVQFHAVQAAVCHAIRQHPKEVAHAHTRLQNITGLKAHLLDRIIDGTNHHRRGVVGVQGTGTGSSILILGKQSFQFGVLFCPTIFAGVKGIRQTAPTHILGKHLLFLGGGTTMLLFQLEQGADGFNVPGIFLLCAALAQMVVCDAEVSGRHSVQGFIQGSSIREGLHLSVHHGRDGQFVQFLVGKFRFGLFLFVQFPDNRQRFLPENRHSHFC